MPRLVRLVLLPERLAQQIEQLLAQRLQRIVRLQQAALFADRLELSLDLAQVEIAAMGDEALHAKPGGHALFRQIGQA